MAILCASKVNEARSTIIIIRTIDATRRHQSIEAIEAIGATGVKEAIGTIEAIASEATVAIEATEAPIHTEHRLLVFLRQQFLQILVNPSARSPSIQTKTILQLAPVSDFWVDLLLLGRSASEHPSSRILQFS